MLELNKVYCVDNVKGMCELDDECIDLIPTDPQYGWNFMGKDWDKALPPQEAYDECFRVLKSGGFLFWMAGARFDGLIENGIRIRNAGFNVNFSPIFWTFASGFPKAQNISKDIDKRACKQELIEKLGRKPTKEEFDEAWKGFREVVGIKAGHEEFANRGNLSSVQSLKGTLGGDCGFARPWMDDPEKVERYHQLTKSKTPEAQSLDGAYAGFQPKPAVEVIIVAMKPLSEKTYVDQALLNKKGVMWLDDCRIPHNAEKLGGGAEKRDTFAGKEGWDRPWMHDVDAIIAKRERVKCAIAIAETQGRFPSHLLVSDDVLNDGIDRKSGWADKDHQEGQSIFFGKTRPSWKHYNDSGSFSRYFSLDAWWTDRLKSLPEAVQKTFPFLIVPKASKSEKDKGLEELPDKIMARSGGAQQAEKEGKEEYLQHHIGLNRISKVKNNHPTVKPIKLGAYLIMLGSREGDTIVDPFAGSGSFLLAAQMLSRNFIGFEISEEYCKIAEKRLVQETLFTMSMSNTVKTEVKI